MSGHEKHIETQFEHKTPGGRGRGQFGPERMDEMTEREARQAIYRGVTMSDLEVIFRMDRRTILSRMQGVKPVEKRGAADCYAIREVAPFLVKPAGDLGEYIQRMRPGDLPPLLQKEYWNGLRAKQAYLENEGQLWRTDLVMSTMGEVFKTLRTGLLLLPDEIERKTSLTGDQREEIKSLVDGLLEKMRESLNEQFGGAPTEEERPGSEPPYDDTFDLDLPTEDTREIHDDTFDLPDDDL